MVRPSALLGSVLLGFAACDSIGEGDAPSADLSSPLLVDDATAVITGRLFLSEEGDVLEEGVVVLAGDRVACSGEQGVCRWPEGTREHSFPESTILPGLIDLHVHARPHFVGAFLPAGVTTVRDANNALTTIEAMRAVEGAPRILASGPLLDGPDAFFARFPGSAPGHPDEDPIDEVMPVVVASSEEAVRAVEALAEAGTHLVKLYEQLPPDAFREAVDAAHGVELPVAADLGMAFTRGLSGAQVDIVDAARAGVTTVEHLSGLALAYQRRGGDPFSEPVEEAIVDEIAAPLLEAEAAYVPTLATALRLEDESLFGVGELPGVAEMAPIFEPEWGMIRSIAERQTAAAAADRRLVEALFPRLHAGGATLGAGSDVPAAPGMYPGWALHQELEALVHLGMTPTEALQAATHTAADLVERDELGHLDRGARADLVVVEGDPSTDITDSRRVRAVWFGGEAVDLDGAWNAVAAALRQVTEGASAR
jgi:imidazolonepropionase-like amidohydrolase